MYSEPKLTVQEFQATEKAAREKKKSEFTTLKLNIQLICLVSAFSIGYLLSKTQFLIT